MGGCLLLEIHSIKSSGLTSTRGSFVWQEILGSIDTSVPRPNLGKIALRRKNKFYSVEEAKSHLGAKPPFSIFDPGAFDGYVRHGLKNIEGCMEEVCIHGLANSVIF